MSMIIEEPAPTPLEPFFICFDTDAIVNHVKKAQGLARRFKLIPLTQFGKSRRSADGNKLLVKFAGFDGHIDTARTVLPRYYPNAEILTSSEALALLATEEWSPTVHENRFHYLPAPT